MSIRYSKIFIYIESKGILREYLCILCSGTRVCLAAGDLESRILIHRHSGRAGAMIRQNKYNMPDMSAVLVLIMLLRGRVLFTIEESLFFFL